MDEQAQGEFMHPLAPGERECFGHEAAQALAQRTKEAFGVVGLPLDFAAQPGRRGLGITTESLRTWRRQFSEAQAGSAVVAAGKANGRFPLPNGPIPLGVAEIPSANGTIPGHMDRLWAPNGIIPFADGNIPLANGMAPRATAASIRQRNDSIRRPNAPVLHRKRAFGRCRRGIERRLCFLGSVWVIRGQ